ncbi:MAG: hypothetical protein Q8O31_05515 [Rhodocyclaceae bacterium]|nr:hypothetical protein [Rhodocyclaceae bacterium]
MNWVALGHHLYKAKTLSGFFHSEIDRLVYEAFELSADEIALIEAAR